ncbi:MAG: Mrp/NBP35 family ATP-binding protein, partial [Chloroflexi bacterium]|nr:Mrp/NBP35 family ATP-binding protein [Chloroflexota bacterium]
ASGKGGVGKSTVSVNLALALAKSGARVGLLDADIYGPNVPLMMGVQSIVQPTAGDHGLIPVMNYGVKMISMGFFIPEGQAVVWRGPMIHGAIQQLLRDVDWGELDYMIIDLPPGTGDASLSLAQLVPLTGAVIVITPQAVAMQDASKAIHMFNKLNVPILGLVENMSYYTPPGTTDEIDIFGRGGGQSAARRYGIDFLGELPLDPEVRIGGDNGKPVIVAKPDSVVARKFEEVARSVASKISIRNMSDDLGAPVMMFTSKPKK